MSFTEGLWQNIEPIYAAILAHPFIRELSDGSLSRERFVFYIKQDSLYLQEFSRALAIAGARSPSMANLQTFVEYASGVVVIERALHEGYFREFGATLDVGKAPACFAYSHFLLSTTSLASYPEAVAALLPCFWIYREVGLEIFGRSKAGLASNPYARWIETYSGEQFISDVDRAIAIVDEVAAESSPSEQARMLDVFNYGSRLEWMFWDSAYRLESWPPVES